MMATKRKSRTPLPDRVVERGILAAAVHARRQELSLRQDELAQLAGVGTRFVNDVETGKQTVRLDKLRDLLTVLGLHLRIEYGQTPTGIAAGDRLSAIYNLTSPAKDAADKR
jgi:y4mF family transcriptional regulator